MTTYNNVSTPAYFVKTGTDERLSDAFPATKRESILKELRVRIGTLLKTDNVSFLIGAGASICAGGISLAQIPLSLESDLIQQGARGVERIRFSQWLRLFYNTLAIISKKEIDIAERRESILRWREHNPVEAIAVNLEDYLSWLHTWRAAIVGDSVILDLPEGLRLRLDRLHLDSLIGAILKSLTRMLNLPSGGDVSKLTNHRRFIKKVLTRPLNLRRVNLFTLNYDTLIEQAADAEGAVVVDGFIGSLDRIFRPESFDLDFYFPAQTTEGRVHRFDRAIHLYKLHGSLTWRRGPQSWDNPYGISCVRQATEGASDILIYPSPLKYGQALDLPYSELFRRLGNAVAQSQSVLFTIGYGFGDEHVNSLVRQALAIPSFTLVVVDPAPKSDFVKTLANLGDERIWLVQGSELGTFENFVSKLLPDLCEEQITEKVIQTVRALQEPKEGDPDAK